MAWIELHDNLPDHQKTIDLANELRIDKDTVVGKLVRLWTWALNEQGNLAVVCYGFDEATDTISRYLEGGRDG